jgi:hypothetical protein
MRGLARVEAHAALPERDPNTMSDDQMVEHVDVKQFAGLYDLAGHQGILGAGSCVA